MRRILPAAGLLVSLCRALPVHAQTVDPLYAEFDPSPDHDAVVDARPVVSNYVLEFYQVGATQPFQTGNLGKPTPGILYEARVAAVGPAGVGRSEVSNQFTFSSPCMPTISPTSASIGASGGTGSVSVSAAAGCAWTATSGVAWISITSGASGTGNGTVAYRVAANATTASRTGTLTIAGRTFTLSQPGASAPRPPVGLRIVR